VKREVLDNIPFAIDQAQLFKALHMDDGADERAEVLALAQEAAAIARPKALYRVAYIDSRGDDFAVINGVRLASRILAVNLEKVHRVFPYVATAGMELEQWADSKTDILERFWADAIMMQAVRRATLALSDHLQAVYQPGTLARMNPGSLKDWPLREQRPLFTIVGDVEDTIGVHLTDSFLMVPRKSVSGIQFPTDEAYENCQLCDREPCPGRRAPYDASLFERKYKAPQGVA